MLGFDSRHRPSYHFMPVANWMNDPNGLTYLDGLYHMFYQYNPYGAHHGNIHWGHATSLDMLHWQHLPIALCPTPGGPDWSGCYSGCAVDNEGVPTLVYTGVRPECQCIAESHDGMLSFDKPDDNPVIPAPPEGLTTTGFRDPCVWKEDDHWRMIVGSGISDQGGTIFAYTSPDLHTWTYEGRLCSGKADETGTMWECPDLFDLGDAHMLVFSPIPMRQVYCMTGTYADGRFARHGLHPVDLGRSFYAPQTLGTPDGRRIMWGWLRERREKEAQIRAGWSGVMSLPREVSIDSSGRPTWRVVDEIKTLRQHCLHNGPLQISPNTRRALLRSSSAELCLEIAAAELNAPFKLGMLANTDDSEKTLLSWDGNNRITLDTTKSSTDHTTLGAVTTTEIVLDHDEKLNIDVYLDASVIEVFVNNRYAITERIYPTHQSDLVWLESDSQNLLCAKMECWSLAETGV